MSSSILLSQSFLNDSMLHASDVTVREVKLVLFKLRAAQCGTRRPDLTRMTEATLLTPRAFFVFSCMPSLRRIKSIDTFDFHNISDPE